MSSCSQAIGVKWWEMIQAFLSRAMISFGQVSSGSLEMQEDFEHYLHKSLLLNLDETKETIS